MRTVSPARGASARAADARSTREKSLTAADQLREGSALLTTAVRGYVVTGDRSWLQQYWTEVDTTHSRNHAITALTDLGTPAGEMALIAQAGDNSTGLVAAETRAQRLILEATVVAPTDMPSAVAQYQLPASDTALPAAEKRRLAETLVFGRDYLATVEEIMAPIEQFTATMTARVNATSDEALAHQTGAEIALTAVAVALLAALATIVTIVSRQVAAVLNRYAHILRERDPYDLSAELPAEGVAETRIAADAFNGQQHHLGAVLQEVQGAALQLEGVTGRLSSASTQLVGSAHATSRGSETASAAAHDVSANVEPVAAGTEEMNASIREIASATEDISATVLGIQHDAQATSAALGDISEIVARINESQATIASAVEEQTATTNEMSRSVQDAATGARGIAGSISEVAGIAQESATAAGTTGDEVDALAELARSMGASVRRFTMPV